MAENPHLAHSEHRHRRHKRKSRKWQRRLVVISVLVFFFAAWGLAVIWYTNYLGRKEQLGQKYHRVVPFNANED